MAYGKLQQQKENAEWSVESDVTTEREYFM